MLKTLSIIGWTLFFVLCAGAALFLAACLAGLLFTAVLYVATCVVHAFPLGQW